MSGRPRRYGRTRWSEAELVVLRREWGEISGRSWRKHLPRRTWVAIRQKAEALGLPFGAPQGWLSMREAARRAGFGWKQLERVLRDAGVRIKQHPFATPGAGTSARWRIVEWDAVREAVEALGECEKVKPAAERRGLTGACLWCWLRDAGVIEDRLGRGGRAVRLVPSSVIDAVVAARRTPADAYRSVREAARLEGVGVDLLDAALKRAGFKGGGKRGSRRIVPKALVRQVLEARRAA